ncbi:unknown [Bacteroides finegoldii CAG:203]|uniref:Uncharacterized protein n=1 Tax=Bacteroides finegoldii TaxID=338188 RepID=A0A174BME4_9BACE|nr:unknown [Bacteroides finegoldii CAG:203]CUO01399.1 Uncharacterised protein [Bacteroides finegoldii]
MAAILIIINTIIANIIIVFIIMLYQPRYLVKIGDKPGK